LPQFASSQEYYQAKSLRKGNAEMDCLPVANQRKVRNIVQQTREQGKREALMAHSIKSGVSAKLVKRFKKETEEEKC
jgi:hypothetical protein